jgi:UDP-N-acetylmuramyl pentapeptide phosphotransferase/UDP-N-acetylglucosamine-1-phosphate transferase
MHDKSLLIAPILSFLIGVVLVRWMLARPGARLALDHPNERSLHSVPVPRTGGLGIMGGWVAGALLLLPQHLSILACASILACISLIDDWRGLSVAWRFLAHSLVAAAFAWITLQDMGPLYLFVVVVGIVWMTNLYNFMDGSDGLAGGMALFGFAAYAAAAWLANEVALTTLCASVAAAAAAFLLFNFPPARIFMGDAGSIPVGFLAAAVGVLGGDRGHWPLWFPVLVFSPFIVDATATLGKRLIRGEKVWRAHREHYYQRMVRSGLGHRHTALIWYGLMLAAAASALAALNMSGEQQVLVLVGWLAVYVLAALAVDRRWTRYLDAEGSGADAQ